MALGGRGAKASLAACGADGDRALLPIALADQLASSLIAAAVDGEAASAVDEEAVVTAAVDVAVAVAASPLEALLQAGAIRIHSP